MSNTPSPVCGFEQTPSKTPTKQAPSCLVPNSKRLHSPSPQKPKKRVKERLDFEKGGSKMIDNNFVYQTPTQKYFDKLQQDVVTQRTQMEEKEREIEMLEESYSTTDNSPKCTNCHVSGHNKSNCTFPHCVSAAICNDIKRHPDESKYIKERKD